MNKKRLFAMALIAGLINGALATEGINLIGLGPVQQGTAGAGVASAKDSTWLLLNPAGLTDVGRQVDTSFQLFAPVRDINSIANPGAGTQEDGTVFYIPAISASLGCCRNDNGFFGIGLYGTSGMGVDYGAPRVGGSAGDTFTELSIAKLTLTYAHKFDNGLSIGFGPVFVFSRFKTDMETQRVVPPTVPADGDWDEAAGAGAIFGVNQQVNDRLKIGASYITEQYMSEFDEYSNLLNGSLNLPQQLTVGAAYNVLTNLEAALDYRWIGWDKLHTLGGQFGWEDQHIVKAGLTWGTTERLTLRGGVSHGNSPIGEEDVFPNALFPAIMETHLTTGASYAFENVDLHFAYVHAMSTDLTDNNLGPGTRISMYQNSVTLGASWKF